MADLCDDGHIYPLTGGRFWGSVGPVDRRPEPNCDKCGANDWVPASEQQYAAVMARGRKKLGREPSTPDRIVVCQGCGTVRVALVATFFTP